MKNFSNAYIYSFSAIMVVLVAALLSFASISLKPFQDKNVEIAKKYDILKSIHKATDVDNAKSKNAYIESEYKTFITNSYVVNSKGKKIEGIDAFNVDLKVELAKEEGKKYLPVFESMAADSSKKYILPVRGKGLWGPLWGYVALYDDMETVYGVTFDHKGETPGLGAEINTTWFQDQFIDKVIYKNGALASIGVLKLGEGEINKHSVNAISGGTITSKGLEEMLKDCLLSYQSFFESSKTK